MTLYNTVPWLSAGAAFLQPVDCTTLASRAAVDDILHLPSITLSAGLVHNAAYQAVALIV